MSHTFRQGDRVCNGQAYATVVRTIADDALEVIYDSDIDNETTTECAMYFKHLKADA
jgi:hypothetical protein